MKRSLLILLLCSCSIGTASAQPGETAPGEHSDSLDACTDAPVRSLGADCFAVHGDVVRDYLAQGQELDQAKRLVGAQARELDAADRQLALVRQAQAETQRQADEWEAAFHAQEDVSAAWERRAREERKKKRIAYVAAAGIFAAEVALRLLF